MGRRAKAISLRWSLLRSFVVLILLSSLIVLVLTWVRSLDTEKRLSNRLIQRGANEARRELDRFLAPATIGVEMGLVWGRSGNLSLEAIVGGAPGADVQDRLAAVRRLNALLFPYVRAHAALSSVQIADDHGHGFLVLQLGDGRIRNRVVDRESWGKQTLWFDVDLEGVPTAHEWKAVDYEPRKRGWYTGALSVAPGQVHWTEPSVFFTTKDLGITAAGRWQTEGVDHVIAYDVLLTDLTRFTQAAANQVSPHALMVIGTEDWRLLGLPNLPGYEDPKRAAALFLEPIASLKRAEITAAIAAAPSRGRDQVFDFESEGEAWWGGIERHELGRDRAISIGVLIPASDLLADVAKQRLFLLIATGIALLAALLYSLLLSRSYSRPLEALAEQSRRIGDLDFSTDTVVEGNLREFQALAAAQRQSLSALQSFAKYVPLEVVRELVGAGEVAQIGGRDAQLTVLFTDIAGFTGISERMSPQALTAHMAEYFECLIDIIKAHGGTVDKMVGDAIVAFWGAPTAMDDHAARAVRAVLVCRSALDSLNAKWADASRPPLPTRFGLCTGPVVVGNIGAPTRLAYTVLGDTVNAAARLEGLNKKYGTLVLADASVRDAAGPGFEWRRLDRAVVVGRSIASELYELLDDAHKVPLSAKQAARDYEAAWDLYAARCFDEAAARLVTSKLMDDPASQRLHALCERFAAEPPPEDWDGVTRMESK